MPQVQKEVRNVRLVNKSRYKLSFVAPKTYDDKGKVVDAGGVLNVDARGKLDIKPEEWAKFENCAGVVEYRDKVRWLIVAKQHKAKRDATFAELPEKAALEHVHACDDSVQLHEWLDDEKRKDVEIVIKARIATLANDNSKPAAKG